MDSSKSLLDVEILLEASLKDLRNIPEYFSLTDKQQDILADATQILIEESLRLPFLDGVDRTNCENSIKNAKGIYIDTFVCNARQSIEEAKNIGINTIKNVLTVALKAVLPL